MDAEKKLGGFQTLLVTRLAFPDEGRSEGTAANPSFVYEVRLNRPKQRNAFNREFWEEFRECFDILDILPSCRCIVVTAEGPVFTAGIDLALAAEQLTGKPLLPRRQRARERAETSKSNWDAEENMEDSTEKPDRARIAASLRRTITKFQDCFTSLEKCSKPIIVCIGGPCVGAGVDLICSCDIRVASKNAWFSVKEVDIGLAADVGTLQRLPRIVGNDSWVREICYTGRRFDAEEAKRQGLLSKLVESEDEMRKKAVALAHDIAAKSPVAVSGIKFALNYTTRRTVEDELRVQAIWNAAMLQTNDIPVSMSLQSMQRGSRSGSPDTGHAFACL
ncbi:enoyl-CoA hydratase/isomerase family protein [Besnoitia besnoiti]|uniref:Enoyl-CoA hydratase/isomerase family protein n=1 Tax=Besnoitia besnoiti TaxID=94643 RepID=A0A2A9MFB8_BESBE|nr:enoyl-CoA hydratase/isomerase family protein [Besnoitia besnoiti]PFH34082.1 enoyl-CoA hydratase/isomerase family protein [Besnoitia besnoiti]